MTERPLFLITNDDGVHARGILALAEMAQELGEVFVVAPNVEKSASSHSISIANPLKVEHLEGNTYAVTGSPADCVILALSKIMPRKPDWVLSGINRGPNLGNDTLYSGTVGAALEGCLRGVRGMAISSFGGGSKLRYDTASNVLKFMLKNEHLLTPMGNGILNINVPSVPFEDIKGIAFTSLSRRLIGGEVHQVLDPRKKPYYWLGSVTEVYEDIEGSDFSLITKGYVTVSVLKPTLLDEEATASLKANFPSKLFATETAR